MGIECTTSIGESAMPFMSALLTYSNTRECGDISAKTGALVDLFDLDGTGVLDFDAAICLLSNFLSGVLMVQNFSIKDNLRTQHKIQNICRSLFLQNRVKLSQHLPREDAMKFMSTLCRDESPLDISMLLSVLNIDAAVEIQLSSSDFGVTMSSQSVFPSRLISSIDDIDFAVEVIAEDYRRLESLESCLGVFYLNHINSENFKSEVSNRFQEISGGKSELSAEDLLPIFQVLLGDISTQPTSRHLRKFIDIFDSTGSRTVNEIEFSNIVRLGTVIAALYGEARTVDTSIAAKEDTDASLVEDSEEMTWHLEQMKIQHQQLRRDFDALLHQLKEFAEKSSNEELPPRRMQSLAARLATVRSIDVDADEGNDKDDTRSAKSHQLHQSEGIEPFSPTALILQNGKVEEVHKPTLEMDTQDVSDHLRRCGLAHPANLIESTGIDGKKLMELNDVALLKMMLNVDEESQARTLVELRALKGSFNYL